MNVFSELGKRTLIMGILNVTPDSFSDGGKYFELEKAVEHARQMIEDGADIIDVGAESTRPFSEPVSAEEQIRRVRDVIYEISKITQLPISIDTTDAKVAKVALDNGASIINDISGAQDDAMRELIVKRKPYAVLMHMRGTPENMQNETRYDNLIEEIYAFLKTSASALTRMGASKNKLIIDPGFGFGKSVRGNLEIIRRLGEFKKMGLPILIGVSKKSTIGEVLGGLYADERMEGTAAATAISIANGADIVRVHDVKEMSRVVRMTDALVR